jgi:hypothetical protein
MTQFGTLLDSLLSGDRIANLIKYSQYTAGLPGYITEWGVFRGGSLEILAKYNPDSDLIAVDSFQGLPAPTEGIDFHNEHDFSGVDFNGINGFFRMVYPRVRIIKGFIPQVFEFFDPHVQLKFSHIDLDLYQSILDALDFIVPRTVEGGIILLDDYKVRSTPGCQKAVDEFFKSYSGLVSYHGDLKFWDSPTAKSHNQYLIVK